MDVQAEATTFIQGLVERGLGRTETQVQSPIQQAPISLQALANQKPISYQPLPVPQLLPSFQQPFSLQQQPLYTQPELLQQPMSLQGQYNAYGQSAGMLQGPFLLQQQPVVAQLSDILNDLVVHSQRNPGQIQRHVTEACQRILMSQSQFRPNSISGQHVQVADPVQVAPLFSLGPSQQQNDSLPDNQDAVTPSMAYSQTRKATSSNENTNTSRPKKRINAPGPVTWKDEENESDSDVDIAHDDRDNSNNSKESVRSIKLPENTTVANEVISKNNGRSEDTVKQRPNEVESKQLGSNDNGQTIEKGEKRFRIVSNKWNPDKTRWEDVDDDVDKIVVDQQCLAIFRRQMDAINEKNVQYEEIEIHDKELKNLLAETNEWWKDEVARTDLSITEQSPFYHFVWNWRDLEEAWKTKPDDTQERKQTRKHLQKIMLRIKSSDSLRLYFRSRESMLSSAKISFEFLWTLFKHGEKVYARSYMNEQQMFEVKDCSAPPLKGQPFKVTCCAFDWDGYKFSTYSYDFYIKEFTGEKPINSLEVFPKIFHRDEEGETGTSLDDRLLNRGRKYLDLCTREPATCEYKGTALVTPSRLHRLTSKRRSADTSWNYSDPRQQLNDYEEVNVTSIEISGSQGKVITDNLSFLKSERNTMKHGDMPPLGRRIPFFEPVCVCGTCKISLVQRWRPESTLDREADDLSHTFAEDEERLRFLPPRLLGFALKEKVWGQFLVDRLTRNDPTLEPKEAIEKREAPFKRDLQLNKGSKDLLWAFIKHHGIPEARKSESDPGKIGNITSDIIEGKGQGLAILLHGPPGVGKTLTAETIALATGRPLLTVSVADIGVQPQEAEKNLNDVFEDAARWKAVLLMDEADVFVEERQKRDLNRNALVSVLLRCLEYYDGIIILTTNRVRSIDLALQSRIQLAIPYRNLTTEQRRSIYINGLNKIPDREFENREKIINELRDSQLVKPHNKANGRQIRNIVTYARALARSEKQLLKLEHLVKVDETTTDFITHIDDVVKKQRMRNEIELPDLEEM